MDKIIELLETRLTPIIFVIILLTILIASLFSDELKGLLVGLIKHKRTRGPSIVCLALVVSTIVVSCCYTFELWVQIILLVSSLLLCIFPFIFPYFESPIFFFLFQYYRRKRSRAPELIDKYVAIKKYALLTRDKYLYACKLEEYCEVLMNYKLAYSYFVTFDGKKLYRQEEPIFYGRYGEILVMLGSIKTGIEYLKKSNDIVAEDRLAFAYEQIGEYDEALQIMTKLKDEAETKDYDDGLKAMILNDYARIFALTNELTQSLSFYNEALKYAKKNSSDTSACLIYSNLIINLYNSNDIATANKYYDEYLAYLNNVDESMYKVLELNNIKMLKGRILKDVNLVKESIKGIEDYLDKMPRGKRVFLLSQLIDIKSEFEMNVFDNISKLVSSKEDIDLLDVPTRADVFARLDRVTKIGAIYNHPIMIPFRKMVNDYYNTQALIDASNYAETLPSVSIIEKNRWMLMKYLYMFRGNQISFEELNKRYLEIVDVMKDLAFDFQEADIKMMYIHELFAPSNLQHTNKPYPKSVYHDYAVKEVKEVLDYVFTTPYKIKTTGLISLLYIYALSCELYSELEKLNRFIGELNAHFRHFIRFDMENLSNAINYYENVVKANM